MLLANFWYVLAESSALGDKPLRVRALAQDFVLFRRRSDRRAVALSDRCVHRMASLSEGAVDGDCVRCPYHGWAYGADGACEHIPANGPDAVVPRRARVDSYPVVERYGWVWVFLGDAPESERPPIPALDALESEGTRAVRGEFLWRSGATRVVENTVDVAHTPFLHRGSFGNAEDPTMPAYDVIEHEHHLEAHVELRAPTPRGLSRLVMGNESVNRLRLLVFMPNVTCLDSTFSNGWRMQIVASNLPVDARTTLTRYVQVRSFLKSPLADAIARRLSQQILREDQATVESQRPSDVPLDLRAELSVRSDALSIAYRRKLRGYVERGWRLSEPDPDREALVVIRSPARADPANDGAWVLDPRQR